MELLKFTVVFQKAKRLLAKRSQNTHDSRRDQKSVVFHKFFRGMSGFALEDGNKVASRLEA